MACEFLKSVANYYCDHYEPKKWKDITFVFPSHRACVFFRQVLSEVVAERNLTIFGARTITFDDLIALKAQNLKHPLRKADNVAMAFELYEAYCRIVKQRLGEELNVDFARFYTWAAMFLGDFDDVDKYMVNPREIFTTVLEYNELSDDLSHFSEEQRKAVATLWKITFDKHTEIDFTADGQQIENVKYCHTRFVDTYRLLYNLYIEFNKALEQQGMAYTGRLYREVAMAYANGDIAESEDAHYAFVGFNALTQSEIDIFKYLNSKEERASFFWDYTPQMLEPIIAPKINEYGVQVGESELEYGPGRFIRSFINKFKAPSDYQLPTFERSDEDKINIYLYAYPQGQMDRVSKFLADKKIYSDCLTTTPRTAIVLTDENMLLPVISSLPQNDSNLKINVTMGYPLKFSQVYGLVDLLKRLHVERRIESGSNTSYYYRLVMPILQHPCITRLCGTEIVGNLVNKIVKDNIVRINSDMFVDNELLKYIFSDIRACDVANYMKHIFRQIAQCDDCDEISRECATKIVQIANRFGDVLAQYSNDLGTNGTDLKVVLAMFSSLVSGQTVDLLGEPLGGLQIMGILETRTVDFDNIIVMDLNDGIFPKKNSAMTFLPYVIRQGFGLPTHEFQDSIFSYYFFRLIHRAKHIDLLYSETTDADRQGPSRFLQQIKYEYDMPNREVVVVHNSRSGEYERNVDSIEKTPEVLVLLSERFNGSDERHQLSPTAIVNYIKCPIYFYIANVMRIDDADEVIEEADMRVLGNIFHGTMENLYKAFIGKQMTRTDRDLIRQKPTYIEETILKNFGKSLNNNEDSIRSKADLFGRNILNYNIVFRMVSEMLKNDHDVFIDGLEKKLSLDKPIKIGQNKVMIGGVIDRLHREVCSNDKLEHTFILDYKTGKSEDLNYKKDKSDLVDSLFEKDKNKAILQTMIYAYILYQKNPQKRYSLAVIYLKELMKSGTLDYAFCINGEPLVYDTELNSIFSQRLNEFLEEIYSPNKLFSCRDKSKCNPSNGYKCKFYSFCKNMGYTR